VAPPAPDPDERGPVVAVLRLFAAQLGAVVGIAALIAVAVAVLGPDDGGQVRAGTAGATATATPAPSAATSTAAAPPPSTPAAPASTAPSTPATSAPAPASTAPSTATPKPAPKVDVLNQSAGNGAAGEVARQLRDEGWRIGRVDDFRGNVSTTTVYWLDRSDRKEARQLAEDLGGVRVQEGFSTLKDGRLSVILVETP
jgi:hypothetical protein